MSTLQIVQVVTVFVFVVLAGTGLTLLLGAAHDWVHFRTRDMRRGLRLRWQTRHLPKLVAWENLQVTAVARRKDYRRALKRNPEVKYPVVPEAVTFADPYTTFGEILTQTHPCYFVREGVSGNEEDLRRLLSRSIFERKPMLIPFVSFTIMSRRHQIKTFSQFSSGKEAIRFLTRKGR